MRKKTLLYISMVIKNKRNNHLDRENIIVANDLKIIFFIVTLCELSIASLKNLMHVIHTYQV